MTEKIDVSPKLYEAATESLVSDASATSTFEKMINVAFTHSTPETFIKEVKGTEKLIKKEFEVTSMPVAWRSAKSVIQTAMKLGLKLIDDNGVCYGKTNLQAQIKKEKSEIDDKEPVTNEKYALKIIRLLDTVPMELSQKVVLDIVRKHLSI